MPLRYPFNTNRFTADLSTFDPKQFGQFGSPQLPTGFDPDELSFRNPNISSPSAVPDTSNIGFSQNNSPQFGNDGAGFNDLSLDTSSGITGFQLAQLGLGGLKAGSGILDALQRRKNLKLARDAFNFQKTAFDKNFGLSKASFDNQVTTVNNRINDQNAFKRAQGRTDLAKLVV